MGKSPSKKGKKEKVKDEVDASVAATATEGKEKDGKPAGGRTRSRSIWGRSKK